MKIYSRLFFVSVAMAILTMSANIGHGAELLGKVVKTTGKQVEIKLEGELIPHIGDAVIIGFDMPSVGFVALQGKWKVSAIDSDTITADPDGDTRQPQKDQIAKITSPNPVARKPTEQDAEKIFKQGQNYYYGRNGENINYAKALELYHKASNMGSLDAINSIGYMYGTGIGVTKNKTEALKWFRKAAEKNDADAQRNLGIMYANGWGVAKDLQVAFEWYLKSANQGYAMAQRSLGIAYAYGQGVTQDHKAAVQWYIKAAEQGDAVAQSNLGSMYFRGTGTAQDYQKAAQWYRKSADQGHAMAQHNLGVIYEQGRGVPKNKTQAIIWYSKAAENGNAKAKKSLTRLGAVRE